MIRPGIEVTDTFIHIEGVSRGIDGVESQEGCRDGGVMSRILNRVVVMGRGEMKRQYYMKNSRAGCKSAHQILVELCAAHRAILNSNGC